MTVDVLVLTALKEELDALLQVPAGWTLTDGDPPLHSAVLEGCSGPIRVAAARLTKMGGVATASLATRLIEMMKPRYIAMCGVCAGHPEDTDLGDVVIADRLFQHDEGKIRHDGFQRDLWVDALRDDWLRVAQDMAGPGTALDLFTAPSDDDWKWWLIERLAAGRDPLRSHAFRRYIPDARRHEYLESLQKERLVKLQGKVFALTSAGKAAAEKRRVLYGTLVTAHPFHIHVGPMGSGNAVEAGGGIWDRLAANGMRKMLAVEMEAAAIGRVAHAYGLPFAIVKGVMDHADGHKSDRFKGFAARVAAEVLCKLLRAVVVPLHVPSPSTSSTPPIVGTPEAPWVFISYSHESREHTESVTALVDQLGQHGVDAWIDRHVAAPPDGWPRWMRRQIVRADAVLVVCTATYRRRFEDDDDMRPEAPGKGVGWEGFIASALLHGDRSSNSRFIPVLLDGATSDDIPVELRSTTSFRLPAQLGELLRRLGGRPPVTRSHTPEAKPAARGRPSPPPAMIRGIQSEGVPEAVEEVTMPNPTRLEPHVAMRLLKDFLVESFTEGELRQLAFFHGGSDVAARLPGAAASKEDLAWALVEALWHRALLDDAFFAELAGQRKSKAKHILALRMSFTGDGPSPSGAVVGTSPDNTGKRWAAPKVPGAEPTPTVESAAPPKSNARPTKVAAKTPEEPPPSPLVVSADSSRWSAGEMEARLAEVLKSSEKLARSLDARLTSSKAKSKIKAKQTAPLAVYERVGRRIIKLGTGLGAARELVNICFEVVLAKGADAASERHVARELLCEWLPYGYPEVAQVVLLRFEKHAADPRNLEITTAYEHFVEVYMARLADRRCKFTRTSVDSRGGRSFAESMFPLPPGSSERRSADQVVDLLVRVVGERFAIENPVDVKTRIAVEALKGRAPYLVVPANHRPHGFPDAAIRKLNRDFPQLHVVVLMNATESGKTEDESMIWTMFIDILGDGI